MPSKKGTPDQFPRQEGGSVDIDGRLQVLLDRIKDFPEEFGYDPSTLTYKDRWGVWFVNCFKALTDDEQHLVRRQLEISKREEALNAIMETIVDPPKQEAGATLDGFISTVYNNMVAKGYEAVKPTPPKENFYWKK